MKKTCCCCVSTILFIIIAVVGVFFGGTWYAYDKYGKAYCGISYGEVLGLVPGLYGAKESKIVTNPFDETTDLASFEQKMKSAMFVSESSTFSIKEMLSELLKNKNDNESSKEEAPSENEQQGEEQQQLVNQSDNTFLNLLKELNFDFSSLSDFDNMQQPEIDSKGVISATDKEIAALFSAAFSSVLDNKINFPQIKSPMSSLVSVKQVVISGAEESLEGNVVKENLRLSATIKIDIKSVLKNLVSSTGLPDLLGSVAAAILPKDLFISLVIAPYAADVMPEISINEYSDKNNELLMEMIKNIVNKVGNNENKFNELFSSIDSYIKTVFTKVTTMVDMKFVGNSAELDALYTMMSLLKLNVTKTDFLQMVSYLKCPNQDEMLILESIKPYEKQELDNFVFDFKTNYAVNDSLDLNKDNLIEKIGLVPNNLDISKLNLTKQNSELTTIMKYDAILGLFEQQLKGKNTTGATTTMSTTTDILSHINLKSMAFVEDRKAEERIKIVMEFNIAGMLGAAIGNNEAILHLATQLLPGKIFLTFEMSMSGELEPDLSSGQPQYDENGNVVMKLKYPSDPLLLVNYLTKEQSEKLLITIRSLTTSVGGENLGSQLDADALKLKLSTSIRDAINKLENQTKGKLEVLFTKDGLKLPTVYELMQSMFSLTSDVYNKTEMPDQIRLTIKGLQNEDKLIHESYLKYTSSEEHNGGKITASYENLTQEAILNNSYSQEVDGIKKYFFDATAMLNIYDKNINQTLSAPFTAGGAIVKVKQTVFVDTDSQEQSHVLTEKYYKDLIDSTGFSGKLVIQTAEINIENIVAAKNPLIPNSLNMTYVYNAGEKGVENADEKNIYVFVNNLSIAHTKLIEQIISSAQNKPFSFDQIINEALQQSLAKPIEINLPSVTIPIHGEINIGGVQSVDIVARIKPIIIKFTLEDLIKESNIKYMSADSEEFIKGTAMLNLSKSQSLELEFDELSPIEQAFIDMIFAPKAPEIGA